MQRARNWSRRECENVSVELELLETFLVLHAEPVLFIDDDQSKVLELHVLAEQAVRADDDVNLSFRKIFHDFSLLLCRLEAAHRADHYWKVSQTVAEGSRVLFSKDRRRDENRDLSSGLNGLERCTHSNFCLAVANVSDEKPVHRTRLFHVAFHVGCSRALIWRVFKQEGRLELSLPRRIGNVRRSCRNATAGIEIEKLDRHFLNRRARAITLLSPALSAKCVKPRRRIVGGDVCSRPEP